MQIMSALLRGEAAAHARPPAASTTSATSGIAANTKRSSSRKSREVGQVPRARDQVHRAEPNGAVLGHELGELAPLRGISLRTISWYWLQSRRSRRLCLQQGGGRALPPRPEK